MFEVQGSKFRKLRTSNLTLVSRESGIGDCSRSVHGQCGVSPLLLWDRHVTPRHHSCSFSWRGLGSNEKIDVTIQHMQQGQELIH